MHLIGMYSIYDTVAKEFSAPTLSKNDGVASRMFMNTISKLPNVDGLKLFHVGNFDVDNVECPVVACQAREIPIQVGGKDEV